MPSSVATDHHVPTDRLVAGLGDVAASPRDAGTIAMVVARPHDAGRDVLQRGRLTTDDGLVGDNWRSRGSSSTADGRAHPDAQLTLVNQRFLDLISGGDRDRWPHAGDQLVVDLHLGTDNLGPGDRLRVGTAVVEVTPKPHTGCIKFVRRFGVDAQRLVTEPVGADLRLRGIYVRVLVDGDAAPGDTIEKVDATG